MLLEYVNKYYIATHTIKTSSSESRGEEEAACIYVSSGLRDHYSELFTQMAALTL